jgi:hypothetical protein
MLCVLSLGLVACSPTYNWREVRVGEGSLVALLPCKPEKAERQVPMLGQMVQLYMASCDVADATFVFSSLRLAVGADPVAAAQAWKLATLASLKTPPEQVRVWVPPQRAGLAFKGWQVSGVRQSGQPVLVHVLPMARGQDLYQAAVYGEVPADVLEALVDGLRFAAAP